VRNAAGALLIPQRRLGHRDGRGPASPTNDLNPLVRSTTSSRFRDGSPRTAASRACSWTAAGNYTVVVQPFELRNPDPRSTNPPPPRRARGSLRDQSMERAARGTRAAQL